MKPTEELRVATTPARRKGLDARERPLLPRGEKCFLLTSPFIEPAGAGERFWSCPTEQSPLVISCEGSDTNLFLSECRVQRPRLTQQKGEPRAPGLGRGFGPFPVWELPWLYPSLLFCKFLIPLEIGAADRAKSSGRRTYR